MFAANNPIRFIDVDGEGPGIPKEVQEFGYYLTLKIENAFEVFSDVSDQVGRFILKSTDANDAYIISSQAVYGTEGAKNIDQTPASKSDIRWAKAGAAIPIVSGGLLKKLARIGKNEAVTSSVEKGIRSATELSVEGKQIENIIQGNKSLKNSFRSGKYNIVEAQEDLEVFRVSGGSSTSKGGSFFGITKPSNAKEADELFNIEVWGNAAEEVTPVTIKKGTQFAIGNVEGGKGTQIFVPEFLQKKGTNSIERNLTKTEKLN